jgi:hypothetical protein
MTKFISISAILFSLNQVFVRDRKEEWSGETSNNMLHDAKVTAHKSSSR